MLSAIGTTLNSILQRRSDIAFRLGGEEFGVLFLVSAPESAEETAEKIRSSIQNLGIAHKSNPHGVVTISIGIKTLPPDDNIFTFETLYQQADKALYKAKEKGKNQCAVYMGE